MNHPPRKPPEDIKANAAVFLSKFNVTVCWNPDRFKNEEWKITISQFTTREALGALLLPWYQRNRQAAMFNDQGAQPLQVSEEASWRTLYAARMEKIQEKLAQHPLSPGLVKFDTATWQLPDGRQMLMDGCHTSCAAWIAKLPFEMTVWNLHPPMDPEAIADCTFLLEGLRR